MPQFEFKVRDQNGKLIIGTIDAQDRDTLISRLMDKGYIIVSVKEEKPDILSIDIGSKFARIKNKDLVFLYMQFSNLINSGISLVESLEVLEAQTNNYKLKKILAEIRKDVLSGLSLSQAMKKHPKVFNRLFVNLIKAGETGGMLDKILERIANFSEKEHRLRGKIKSAMAYPIIMLLVAGGVVTFLLTFVFPRFIKIFKRVGANLPLPTVLLIHISNYLKYNYSKLFIYAVILFFIYKYVKSKTWGEYLITRIKMGIPVFGDLIVKASVTRFCRTLGTLLDNGVPIITAMDIVEEIIDNVILADSVKNATKIVREGGTLASAFEKDRFFPPMIIKMIQVGEKTGTLGKMLVKASEFYETEVEMTVETLISMLEPLLIVVMGAVVGFIALAMFLPIFNMTKLVKK